MLNPPLALNKPSNTASGEALASSETWGSLNTADGGVMAVASGRRVQVGRPLDA